MGIAVGWLAVRNPMMQAPEIEHTLSPGRALTLIHAQIPALAQVVSQDITNTVAITSADFPLAQVVGSGLNLVTTQGTGVAFVDVVDVGEQRIFLPLIQR